MARTQVFSSLSFYRRRLSIPSVDPLESSSTKRTIDRRFVFRLRKQKKRDIASCNRKPSPARFTFLSAIRAAIDRDRFRAKRRIGVPHLGERKRSEEDSSHVGNHLLLASRHVSVRLEEILGVVETSIRVAQRIRDLVQLAGQVSRRSTRDEKRTRARTSPRRPQLAQFQPRASRHLKYKGVGGVGAVF